MAASFRIDHEVSTTQDMPEGWTLCLQLGGYHYDDRPYEPGYRFINRRPGGSLQPRGQARIPSAAAMFALIRQATLQGWFVPPQTEILPRREPALTAPG
jgi:hypothetical protein